MTTELDFTLDEIIDGLRLVAGGEKIITAVPIAQATLKAIARLKGQLTGQTALAAKRLERIEWLEQRVKELEKVIDYADLAQ